MAASVKVDYNREKGDDCKRMTTESNKLGSSTEVHY